MGAYSKEDAMPIVRVEMFSGRTHAQKQELARAITEAVANIAHTTADQTIVIFQDVERENWAQAGKLASDEE
jgi:4-oxalocrotonate tautomerase